MFIIICIVIVEHGLYKLAFVPGVLNNSGYGRLFNFKSDSLWGPQQRRKGDFILGEL